MSEYKKILGKKQTRYVIESATGGGSSAGSFASAPSAMKGIQRRGNLLSPVEGKDTVTVPVTQKPRQGPLKTQTGGGAHRDKKKEQKAGKEKHRKPFAESEGISKDKETEFHSKLDKLVHNTFGKRKGEAEGFEDTVSELKRPSGSMFLKFRVKKLPDDQEMVMAYGGFGTTPKDVTVANAKIKPFGADNSSDVISRIKAILADRHFVGVKKIILDIPDGLADRLADIMDYAERDERLDLYTDKSGDEPETTGRGKVIGYGPDGKKINREPPQAQVGGSSRGVANTGMVTVTANPMGQKLIYGLLDQGKISKDTKVQGSSVTFRKSTYDQIRNVLGNDQFQRLFTKTGSVAEGMDSLTFWKQQAQKAGGAANIDWYAIGVEHGKQGIVMNPPYGVGAKAVTLYGKGLDAGKQGVAEGLTKQARARKEAESVKAAIERLEQQLNDPNPHIDKDDIRRRLETEKRRLELYRDVLDEQGVAEGEDKTQNYEMMMRNGQVKKFVAKDDADAKRIAAGHGAKSVIRLRSGVPAGKVSEQGVAEGSDWGEPQEVLADVMSTLERQVEWPLTDVMDPREVENVLQPVRNAINIKLKSLEQGMAEGNNPEYDDEAGMADNNLETLKRAVQGLDDVINAGDNLPEWCQEKIAVAKSMLVTVWDYMLSDEEKEPGMEEDDSSIQAFLAKGGKIQQLPYKKPRKADKTDFGSKHIGGPGDRMRPSRTGTAAKTQGSKVVGMGEDLRDPKDNPCWKGYKPVGTKKKGGRTVPNCVPKESVGEDVYTSQLFNQLENVISEKAVSKAQQKFMGMVHAVQKGEMKAPSKEVAKAAKGMSMKAGHEYAATKHKGLPEKKPKK